MIHKRPDGSVCDQIIRCHAIGPGLVERVCVHGRSWTTGQYIEWTPRDISNGTCIHCGVAVAVGRVCDDCSRSSAEQRAWQRDYQRRKRAGKPCYSCKERPRQIDPSGRVRTLCRECEVLGERERRQQRKKVSA